MAANGVRGGRCGERRRGSRTIAGLALLVFLVPLTATAPVPASANHNWFDCTPSSATCTVYAWAEGSLCFYWTPSFYTAANSRQRAIDSITNWSISSTGRPPTYICGDRPNGESLDPAVCQLYSTNDNRFHHRYIDYAVLGNVCSKWVTGNSAAKQLTTTNSQGLDEACVASGHGTPCWFYHDDSTSGIPSNKWDLESVITHEMGHVFGLRGHFDIGDTPCVVANEPYLDTMCQGGPHLDPGEWYLRTVSTMGHDYTIMCSAPGYGGSC